MTLNQKILSVLHHKIPTDYTQIVAKCSKHGYVRNPLTWVIPKMKRESKGLVRGNYQNGWTLVNE